MQQTYVSESEDMKSDNESCIMYTQNTIITDNLQINQSIGTLNQDISNLSLNTFEPANGTSMTQTTLIGPGPVTRSGGIRNRGKYQHFLRKRKRDVRKDQFVSKDEVTFHENNIDENIVCDI